MAKAQLAGQRFGRLTVIEDLGSRVWYQRTANFWRCVCDCGNEKEYHSGMLTSGKVVSCGCLRDQRLIEYKGISSRKHGMSGGSVDKHPLYVVWKNMKRRCYKSYAPEYKNYGGRGICICEEWKEDFQVFYDWAMASGYKDGLTIERKDNNGNYEPGNCVWITKVQQARNKRNTVKYGEEPLVAFLDRMNMRHRYKAILQSVYRYGMSIETAVQRHLGL